MKNIMHWHPKGHHHRDPSEEFGASEYQLVKDGRPQGTIILTSDGFEAFNPEGQDPGRNATHHWHNHAYTRDNSNEYMRDFKPRSSHEVQDHGYATHHRHNHTYTRESSDEYMGEFKPPRAPLAEDINNEAEEFIEMEHQKFYTQLNKQRTWSSG